MQTLTIFAVAKAGLHPVDWIILALYAVATIYLGWYIGRRQTTSDEYFVGSGNMNPILIGVSLFATLLSTISYLSQPGEMIGKGPMQLVVLLGLPIVYVIVGFGILPILMRQRVTSAYELLEERLGLGVRLCGATMFVALRLVWMSVLTYVAAKAMAHMMGVDERYIFWIVLVTGAVAVVYTSLGGLRAVVITDLIQTILLLGGAWLVIFMVTYEFGGVSWFPTRWHENWDSQPIFPTDLRTRTTFVGTLAMMVTWFICTLASDQTAVQRFMATRDAAATRRSLLSQFTVTVVVTVTLGLLGFSLLAYFERDASSLTAEFLPEKLEMKQDADKLFPHFIAYHLPIGVSGLVIAAMFAAAMSSLDSGVNSITAVVSRDFLERFGVQPKTNRGRILVARMLALAIGGVVLVGSGFVGHIPGNIMALTNKSVNLLVTPIFGLFFFALFVPFARPAGAISGALVGSATAAIIAFSGPLATWLGNHYGVDPEIFGVYWVTVMDETTGETIRRVSQDPISFQWISPIALVVNLAVGTLVSLVLGGGRHRNGQR